MRSPRSARALARAQEQQRRIEKAVRKDRSRRHKDAARTRNGAASRASISFQAGARRGRDGKSFTLLSRDISPSGIRLVGTRRLLGAKVRVFLPQGRRHVLNPGTHLWTCALGEDLFENGGTFLEIVNEE